MLDVHVDVGSLGLPIDADLGEKSLEQKSVPHRIDSGDGEAVRHRGIRRAAASLTENSLFPREIHRVPHHQKKPGETQIPDDSQLML